MNPKQMRTVTIAATIGAAHVALVAGAFLVQGCGTTRGPVALTEEPPMPPRAVPQTPKRLDPITPTPAITHTETRPSTPVRPTPPVPAPAGDTYTVARGDTLSGIASRFDTSVAVLMTLNNISDPDRVIEGQKLLLPEGVDPSAPARPRQSPPRPQVEGAGTYTVQPGDSLSVIAWRSGVKVADIKQVNNLTSDLIRVGQKLVIPTGGNVPRPEAGSDRAEGRPAPARQAEPEPEPEPELDLMADPILPEPGPAVQDRPVTEPARAGSRVDTAGTRRYVVQPGDSLLSVASQWNVSIVDLKRVNDIPDGPLTPGQELRIPVLD